MGSGREGPGGLALEEGLIADAGEDARGDLEPHEEEADRPLGARGLS